MNIEHLYYRVRDIARARAFDIHNMILRLQGKDRLVFQETPGTLASAASYKRVAVVALYPTPNSLALTANLTRGLAENGFFVLAIASRKTEPDVRSQILENCHYLIERFPYGRDFASYRMGIDWLRKQPFFKDVELLALTNDSLAYPRRIGATIKDLLQENPRAQWMGLFEAFLNVHHVQSHFEIFHADIFNSPAFINFWDSYTPTNLRRHLVERGEIELTRALERGGFYPHIHYSMSKVRKDLLARLESIPPDKDLAFRYVLFLAMNRIPKSWRDALSSNKFQDSLSLDPIDIAHRVGLLMEYDDTTRAVGLICNHLYHAPIKRCRKTVTIADLVNLIQGFSAEELKFLERDLMQPEVPNMSWERQKILTGLSYL